MRPNDLPQASSSPSATPGSAWWENGRHPLAQANFAPVPGEVTVDDLKVVGEIPRALRGTYLRNGPNQQFEPPGQFTPIDGDGMVHAVRLDGGRASYRNRWVISRQLTYERELGRGVYGGLADGLNFPALEHVQRAGLTKNVANIHVVPHAGRLLAVSESGSPLELDYDLRNQGAAQFGGRSLSGLTGHPILLPDGRMVAIRYSPVYPFVRYYLFDVDGSVLTEDILDVRDPVMIHASVVADKYVLFQDGPMVFDFANPDLLVWDRNKPVRIGVLPIDGRAWDLCWFEMPACVLYHYFNGYADGSELVLDAEWMTDFKLEFTTDETRDDIPAPRPARLRLDLERGGPAKLEPLSDRRMALPAIDPRLVGARHRYGYAMSFESMHLSKMHQLVRVDFDTGGIDVHEYGPDHTSAEPAYVANPESDREEDGYVVSFVHDKPNNTSELCILSAGDIAAEPIARVQLPQRVPYGFHGSWLADADR